MRYILFILILTAQIGSAQMVTQPGLRDYQISAAALPDSILYIMGTDTVDGSSKQGLGEFHRADTLFARMGDHDFYGLGTGRPAVFGEDSIETADTMYILLHGLSGGLHSKIEFLKDGSVNFDYENEVTGSTKVYQTVQPLQQSQGNVPWVSSIFTAENYGARWNDVHSMGWNMEGGNVLETGKHAFGWVSEGYYQQNATRLRFEDHTIYYDTDGLQRRPESLVITDGYYDEWYKYFTVNDVFGLDPRNNYKSFQFALDADTTISKMYLWSPQSANTKAAEFQLNTTTNRLSISPIGTSNSTFDINAYPFTRAALIQRTEVAATYGLTMATVAGNTSDGYFGNIGIGWGLDLTSGTLLVDSSQVATQYDLTLITGGDDWGADVVNTDLTLTGDGTVGNVLKVDTSEIATQFDLVGIDTDTDDQNLTIEGAGPTYDIAINDGTDVTVSNVYGLTLSEPVANTLGLAVDSSKLATQYDISGFGTMSNWLLEASGTGGTATITNGQTVTHTESAGLDITRSTNNVFYSLDLNEITTDNIPEGDEFLIGSDGSTINEKYPITKFDTSYTNEIQTLDATGTTTVTWDLSGDASDISLTGAGISSVSRLGNAVTVTSTEVDGSTTNEAWTVDADDAETEVISNNTLKFEGGVGIVTDYVPASDKVTFVIDGDEFTDVTTPEADDWVLMHDENGPGADVLQKILWSDLASLVGGTDTNWAEDNLTMTGNRTHTMSTYNVTYSGSSPTHKILDTNGGADQIVLASELGAGAGVSAGISFRTENTGASTEQFFIQAEKFSSTKNTLKISATLESAPDIIFEQANFTGGTETDESHLAINAGMAYTQNYDYSTAADLEIDRTYNILNVTGGAVTDTIKLPEVASTADDWDSALTTDQVQVGQEYTITNFRSGVDLKVAAYNPSSGNSDLIDSTTPITTYSAVTLTPGQSTKFRCVRFASGVGYWFTFN